MGLISNIAQWFRRDTADATTSIADTSSPTDTSNTADRGVSTAINSPDLSYLMYGNNQTELSIATVFRCVKLLSESVANLPIQVMRLKGDLFAVDISNRLNYLLNIQPNPNLNAFDFWVMVVQNVLLTGNAYIVPIYNLITLEVDRLALCNSRCVSHDTTYDRYTISDLANSVYGVYDEDEIIHIKGLSLDGKTGLSVLTFARLTANIATTGDGETLKRFANGGNVRGIVSNDTSVRGFGEYQDKQIAKTAEDLDAKFSRGQHIVGLPGQIGFSQISLSSTDMQFLESRKFTLRELCRFFGVHPSFVFDDTSNNYKSAEMANVAFLSNTLNPILRKIETELLRKLIAPSLATKRKFQFDRRGLYACDLDSKIKYQSQTIAAGIYTVNEWRREENKEPVKGGDAVLVSANLRGIDEALTAKATTPKPEKENKKNNDDGDEE